MRVSAGCLDLDFFLFCFLFQYLRVMYFVLCLRFGLYTIHIHHSIIVIICHTISFNKISLFHHKFPIILLRFISLEFPFFLSLSLSLSLSSHRWKGKIIFVASLYLYISFECMKMVISLLLHFLRRESHLTWCTFSFYILCCCYCA